MEAMGRQCVGGGSFHEFEITKSGKLDAQILESIRRLVDDENIWIELSLFRTPGLRSYWR